MPPRNAAVALLAGVAVLAVARAVAHGRFERRVDAEVRALLASAGGAPAHKVERAELERLPPPVRKWLDASGVVGRESATSVRLLQRGELRAGPRQPWMPARAQQYFATAEPGFVWRVEATMGKLLPFSGRDLYFGGEAHMLIEAASLLPVADARDEKIVQGAMLRFLGEMVWFPSAALRPYIEWSPLDEMRARATLTDHGRQVSAEFRFDEQGRVVELSAERYLGGGPDAKLTPWSVTCTTWRSVRGVVVPVRGDVLWHLPDGDFDYYRWEILDVEANRPELYPEPPVAAHRDVRLATRD